MIGEIDDGGRIRGRLVVDDDLILIVEREGHEGVEVAGESFYGVGRAVWIGSGISPAIACRGLDN